MLSSKYLVESRNLVEIFQLWSNPEQMDFVEKILYGIDSGQIGRVDRMIRPLLQRDFIADLPGDLAERILKYLDAATLVNCEAVSTSWRFQLARAQVWKKMIEQQVKADNFWRGLAEKRKWKKFIFTTRSVTQDLICEYYNEDSTQLRRSYGEMIMLQHKFYKDLYPKIKADIAKIKENWEEGKYSSKTINCNSQHSKGVYCLQYDEEKIVCGLRDNAIKIYKREDLSCSQSLTGHSGSVLCLQYDKRFIITGSSDATIRVWDVETGECLNTLIHHTEAVLHLRFSDGVLVTCSKDRSVAIWEIISPQIINVQKVLVGHRAAVNVVDFDEEYIVSASGDRTIRVWSRENFECERTLTGHKRGIACLQYRGNLIVTGSSDNTIRIWDINIGVCLRVLEGHEDLVRCLRFDNNKIISGAYDGKIKVWDLKAALDTAAHNDAICLNTFEKHAGRVFRLQFDDFQIISSSHDDTIVIWDFLNTEKKVEEETTDPNGNI